MIIPILSEHEMHMARPVAMSLQQLQQLAHGPIVRDGIRYRHDCLEPEDTLLVTVHHRTLIWPIAALVLNVIEAFAVCFPDVDLDSLDWFAGCVFDVAEDKAGFTVRVVGDGCAVGSDLGFVGVEGS